MASIKCKSCNSHNIKKEIVGDVHFQICNDCFMVSANHKIKLGYSCCEDSNIKPVLFAKGKSSYVVKQCITCGYKENGTFKKSLLDEKIIIFNSALHNSYRINQAQFQEDVNKIHSYYSYKRKCRLKSEWCEEEYNDYLSSDIWHHKRERVLMRDEGVCRACGVNNATQVHHLSYRFVGNEPLYDLVSVCNSCHDKISEMDEKDVKARHKIEE